MSSFLRGAKSPKEPKSFFTLPFSPLRLSCLDIKIRIRFRHYNGKEALCQAVPEEFGGIFAAKSGREHKKTARGIDIKAWKNAETGTPARERGGEQGERNESEIPDKAGAVRKRKESAEKPLRAEGRERKSLLSKGPFGKTGEERKAFFGKCGQRG